ncbi:MAG: hypothetical protein PUK59_07750 [Actinomycetaceae bacterium]|nr:hypothetical protein [Actinomycetaceae bacterium]MDY5854331.1 hypothetical protein [Arcanobacterium sp.]
MSVVYTGVAPVPASLWLASVAGVGRWRHAFAVKTAAGAGLPNGVTTNKEEHATGGIA